MVKTYKHLKTLSENTWKKYYLIGPIEPTINVYLYENPLGADCAFWDCLHPASADTDFPGLMTNINTLNAWPQDNYFIPSVAFIIFTSSKSVLLQLEATT